MKDEYLHPHIELSIWGIQESWYREILWNRRAPRPSSEKTEHFLLVQRPSHTASSITPVGIRKTDWVGMMLGHEMVKGCLEVVLAQSRHAIELIRLLHDSPLSNVSLIWTLLICIELFFWLVIAKLVCIYLTTRRAHQLRTFALFTLHVHPSPATSHQSIPHYQSWVCKIKVRCACTRKWSPRLESRGRRNR